MVRPFGRRLTEGRITLGGVSVELLGREPEVAALDSVLAAAAGGSLALALVEGEAGIGKSCLVAAARCRAERRGFQVVGGISHELEQDRPFGAVADALGPTVRTSDPDRFDLSRLLEGHDLVEPSPLLAHAPGLRFRILEGVLTLLEELANDSPLALVLEDLQWADPSTLLVVDHVRRRLSHHPVAVVVTLRPTPRSPSLDRVIEDLHPHAHIELAGLDAKAVAELAQGLLGAPPDAALLALVERAGGNPLFVVELVTALLEQGAIGHGGDLNHPDQRYLPPSFRLTTLRRLSFLPEQSLQVLRAASVLGTTFAVDDLAVVLDLEAAMILAALQEPLRAKLVGEAGDRLAFRHALVRDAIYADLPISARRALHLQTARRLSTAERPVAQVARHFRLGAGAGDREAVRWLRRAGQAAASRAPEAAVELLDAALALAPVDDDERDTLEAELGVALVWAGRLAEGTSRLRAILERPHQPEVHVATRFSLARALLLQGQARACIELLATSTADPRLPASERPRFLAEMCLAHLVGGEVAEAGDLSVRARQAGEELADDASTCLAMNVQAVVLGLRGELGPALALAEQAVARAVASTSREACRIPPQLMLAGLLMDADRLEEGQRMLETARCISEEFGTVWDLPVHHLLSGQAHFHAGHYDDAVAEAEVGLALGEEVGTRVNIVWAHAILAHVCIHRGDLAGAERLVVAGEEAMAATGPQVRGTDWLLWARALLMEATGDPQAAWMLLRALWDGLSALGIVSEHTLLGPDLIRLSVGAGDGDAAREVARAVEQVARQNGSAAARGAALRCRGLAHGDPELLLASVRAYEQSHRRMEQGFAAEEAGVALTAAGRKDEARRCLEDALAVYRSRGARREVRRAEAALRRLGVRPGKRGPRGRPLVGWEALTDTEQQVTRLAAEGLTNPEIGARMFISKRTVESHLSHVFAKLGVSSRVELAGLVARRSPAPVTDRRRAAPRPAAPTGP